MQSLIFYCIICYFCNSEIKFLTTFTELTVVKFTYNFYVTQSTFSKLTVNRFGETSSKSELLVRNERKTEAEEV